MGPEMMGYGYGYGSIVVMLFWILLIAGLVLFIVWLVRQASIGQSKSSDETPLDILKKRYARGEIDKEEFEHKKRDLV